MLSSNIFTNMVLTVTIENITLLVVGMNRGKVFADYVREVIKIKGLKLREVESRSGGEITHGYVSKIVSNSVRSLTTEKLCALARGLGVSPVHLFCMATGAEQDVSTGPQELALMSFFAELPTDKKDVALIFLEGLYHKYATKSAEVKRSVRTKRRVA